MIFSHIPHSAIRIPHFPLGLLATDALIVVLQILLVAGGEFIFLGGSDVFLLREQLQAPAELKFHISEIVEDLLQCPLDFRGTTREPAPLQCLCSLQGAINVLDTRIIARQCIAQPLNIVDALA